MISDDMKKLIDKAGIIPDRYWTPHSIVIVETLFAICGFQKIQT